MGLIQAEVTGTDLVLERLTRARQSLRAAIVESVRRQWRLLQNEIVDEKLSGSPLKRKSGRLAGSIKVGGSETTTSFTDDGSTITAKIGTTVPYAHVHEYGGAYRIREHRRKVMSRLGIREATVREHTANYPERSFLRATLAELSAISDIRETISRAASAA